MNLLQPVVVLIVFLTLPTWGLATWGLETSGLATCPLASASHSLSALSGPSGQDDTRQDDPKPEDTEQADTNPEKQPESAAPVAEDPKKRRQELRQLGQLAAIFRRSHRNGETEHAMTALEHIASIDRGETVELLLRLGTRHPGPPLSDGISKSLSLLRSRAAIDRLIEELEARVPSERLIIAVETLAKIPDLTCTNALLRILSAAEHPTIQTTTLRALSAKPTREVVEGVIDFYGRIYLKRDQIWAETRIALMALTGLRYLEHEVWEAWWANNRETWEPGFRMDDSHGRTKVYRPAQADQANLPVIFGQEIASKRVVFVLDTSESMLKVDPKRMEEGSDAAPPNRLQRAQRELTQAIYKLRSDAKFTIVRFSTSTSTWKKKLTPATNQNKKSARDFIQGCTADGFTSTEAAILAALAVPDVDTIVLISDGSPTVPGKKDIDDTRRILASIRAKNRFRKVAIHTLGFRGALVPFMRKMAYQNGGTYAYVR